MNYVKKKNKCGTKDQNYNGSKVEIRTQSSFMGQQLNGSEEISLRDFEIVKEYGSQRRDYLQKCLRTSMLVCSQHPILTTLIALWMEFRK